MYNKILEILNKKTVTGLENNYDDDFAEPNHTASQNVCLSLSASRDVLEMNGASELVQKPVVVHKELPNVNEVPTTFNLVATSTPNYKHF